MYLLVCLVAEKNDEEMRFSTSIVRSACFFLLENLFEFSQSVVIGVVGVEISLLIWSH